MSHIDQAFINAYADQPVPKTQSSYRSIYSVREPGPTLRVFSQSADTETVERRIDVPRRDVTATNQMVQDSVTEQQLPEMRESAELTLPSLVSERRPLSSFAAPKQSAPTVFKPVFEVDEFRWPEVSDKLITASSKLFKPTIDTLFAASGEGCTLVGIGGANVRVGTSTVSMCLARLAAESGINVALVDGNFVQGDLAQLLGLEFDRGWEDALAGKLPLAECAVCSLRDKITLVPLGGSSVEEIERLKSIQSSVIAGMLRYHYDLVLFDLGNASDPIQLTASRGIAEHCRLDLGIIVAKAGVSEPVANYGIDQLNALFGTICLGIVGNCAS